MILCTETPSQSAFFQHRHDMDEWHAFAFSRPRILGTRGTRTTNKYQMTSPTVLTVFIHIIYRC